MVDLLHQDAEFPDVDVPEPVQRVEPFQVTDEGVGAIEGRSQRTWRLAHQDARPAPMCIPAGPLVKPAEALVPHDEGGQVADERGYAVGPFDKRLEHFDERLHDAHPVLLPGNRPEPGFPGSSGKYTLLATCPPPRNRGQGSV